MIKAVVFDIGGVLAFDIWEHAFLDPEKGLAGVLSLPPDEVKQVGLKMWENFAYRSAKDEKKLTLWRSSTGVNLSAISDDRNPLIFSLPGRKNLSAR